MVTQYSIVSVLLRPEIQEKISIGLLFFDLDHVYFSYSKNKLQASKSLVSAASYHILKDVLVNIEKKIENNESDYAETKGFKIFKNKVFDNTFSSSYISYLSRYANNIISFTNPKEIYLDLTNQNFISLFTKYIDNIEQLSVPVQKLKPADIIRNQLGEKIERHYDVNKELTHEQVQNLITPVRIDFSGRNEIDVYAHTIDMEGKPSTVSNHINSFIQLKTIYAQNGNIMKDFVIAREPKKELYPKQHDIWNQLRSSNLLHYLDLSESEAIIIYAESHGVVPLSKI